MSRILCVINGMTIPTFRWSDMAIWRPWVRCGMWIPAAASHRKHCTAYCAMPLKDC